jgi:putative hydrolase of the HAD superfamily
VIPIQLIGFDLDDTLYPEQDFVKSGFSAVATRLDFLGIVEAREFFRTAWRLFEEGSRGTIFNQALEILGCDFPPERISELVTIYREHKPDIQPFTASVRLLEAIRKIGIITALISDGTKRTQSNKLSALGLVDFFEYIIFTNEYGPDWGKPSLRPFEEVMKLGKVTAASCVYVADNPRKDFLAPNTLGWRTIRVREKTGIYYNEMPQPQGEPQETVERFDSLFDLLLP